MSVLLKLPVFQTFPMQMRRLFARFRGRLRMLQRPSFQLHGLSDSVLDSIGQGVVVLDTEGRVVRFNRFMREQYGWDDSEVGRSAFEERPDLQQLGLQERFREIVERGCSVHVYGLRRITRRGQEVYQNLSGYPLYRADEIVGAVILIEDVTGQYRTQLQLERRTAELDVLHRVALAGAEAQSVDALLARVTEILAETLYPENVGFLLLDETGRFLRLHHTYHGVSPEVREWVIPLGRGITGTVAQTGEPLLVPDVRADPRYLEASPVVRSELCVPLRVAGRVVGVINVDSPHLAAFSEEDLHLVVAVAGHVGTALEKLHFFEEVQRRNEELAARNAIARAVTRSLDVDEILEALDQEIQRLLHPDTFSVALYDAEREFLDVRLVVEEGRRLPRIRVPLAEGGGLTAWIVQERRPLLVRDMEAEADRLPATPRHVTRPARSWLGIPLITRDQVVGVLSVQSFRPAAFDETDRDFLTAVADHVAVAIENARLLEAERRTRQQAETLREVAAALGSTLELDQLSNLVLEYLERLVAYDSASVMLVEGETAQVVAVRGFPDKTRALQVQVSLSEDLAFREVVARRAPIVLRDAAQDPRFRGLGGTEYVRSWICAPLIARDTVIGLLTVDNRKPEVYDERDATLVQAFASHVALAVENAQLYEKMRHMAVTDGLTGLYNSRHFYRLLDEELQRSERYDHSFSLLMFDLDDFKKYNDRYGHLAGDDLLRELAGLVRTITRSSDLAFRYGGEEFILILPETPRPAALRMAERLRIAVQDHEFVVRGGTDVGRITISIGVATYPDDAQSAEDLVHAADMALLKAKKLKNRVCPLPSSADP